MNHSNLYLIFSNSRINRCEQNLIRILNKNKGIAFKKLQVGNLNWPKMRQTGYSVNIESIKVKFRGSSSLLSVLLLLLQKWFQQVIQDIVVQNQKYTRIEFSKSVEFKEM